MTPSTPRPPPRCWPTWLPAIRSVVNRSRRGPQARLVAALEQAGVVVPIHRRLRSQPGSDSKWANPFRLPRDADDHQRAQVIECYRSWLTDQPELLAQIGELRGKALACFCWPKPCHGNVLAELATGCGPQPSRSLP